MFVLGFAAQPLLRRWNLPRVARLGVLIGVVSAALVGAQDLAGVGGHSDSWGAALPVVVTAVVTERLWESYDMDGARAAIGDALLTLGVAVMVTAVLVAPDVRALAEAAPLQLALACSFWTWLAGSYKGLRLAELVRFRPSATARLEDALA